MYSNTIKLLKDNAVIFKNGLTNYEIKKIEALYGISFPSSLRTFLMTAVPISNGFYNWSDTSSENMNRIRHVMNYPVKYAIENTCEIEWCDNWGKKPPNKIVMIEEIKKKVELAPILIPIYSHRYMPIINTESPPVLSIHGTDIIYYGGNLSEYFSIEFKIKNQSEINFKKIAYVPFWSDIM